MEAKEYKCPACGGSLKFSGASGDMTCEYCDSHFNLKQVTDLQDAQQEVAATPNEIKWEAYVPAKENGSFAAIVCPACGAEIVADETVVATECVYCGNAAIIRQKLTGISRPDQIIPFKTTKKQAVEALKKLYKGKKLLPDVFTEENRVEKVSGVYVPYWLFNCKSSAGMVFRATKVRRYKEGEYDCTRTDKYLVTRTGSASFTGIPVDGSSKTDNTYTEAIEPYDYAELVKFNDSYLSGFLAHKYDVSAADCNARATERVRASMIGEFEKSVEGYSTVTLEKANVNNQNGKADYVLMPVWLLNTKYKDRVYTFAMNGQTGKMIGNLPMDRKKAFFMFLKWAGILTGVSYLAVLLSMLIS